MESCCKNKQAYLVIEPYVYIQVIENKLLMYNTFEGHLFESNISSEIGEIFNNDFKKYVYPIKKETVLTKKYFIEFIDNIESYNLGFLYFGQIAPVQIPPFLNVITERLKANDRVQLNDFSLSHLNELSVYLNSTFLIHSEISQKLYKQFLCNYNSSDNQPELNFSNLIEFILPSLQRGGLQRVNLLGGDILKYSKLGEVIKLIINYQKKLNLYLELDSNYKLLSGIISELKTIENISICMMLRKTFSMNALTEFINYFSKMFLVKIFPIIENEDDFVMFESKLKKLDTIKILYKPFYNGKNLNFFEQNVFFEKKDIFQYKHKQSDIYRKLKLNLSEFGKIIILNNGNIYCNINQKPVGNIKQNTIQEIIYNQLSGNSDWFKTRNNEKQCANCLYNAFCPPISNYEYVFKKSNLCHIK